MIRRAISASRIWIACVCVNACPATLPVRNGEVVEDAIDQEEKDKILQQLAMLGYLEE